MNQPNQTNNNLPESKNYPEAAEGFSRYYSIPAQGGFLDQVYAMRYKSYREKGYIPENPAEKFIDEYDHLPNSTSYITYFQYQAIGSIRASVFNPKVELKVPAMDVFSDEISTHIGYDKPFIEANKFVITSEFQQHGGFSARLPMFRNIARKAFETKAKSIIIAVRPEHIRFYKVFFFHPISEAKNYSHLEFDTVLLVCKDIRTLKKRFF